MVLTRNIAINVRKHRIFQNRKIIEVPRMRSIVNFCAWINSAHIVTTSRKSTANLKIWSILDNDLNLGNKNLTLSTLKSAPYFTATVSSDQIFFQNAFSTSSSEISLTRNDNRKHWTQRKMKPYEIKQPTLIERKLCL